MIVLGIDTALGACSAAILDDDRVLAREFEPMVRGHAERLAPMVDSVMRRAFLPFEALERLAVTVGPGTFTGQRVGLAFVRGLGLALKIPAAGVTTLDAMAAEALAQSGAVWAVACVDAKRGEAYLGARGGGGVLLEPMLLSVEAAQARVRQMTLEQGTAPALAGNGAYLLSGIAEPVAVTQPDAVFVARLGLVLPQPSGPPRPLYLREPDAKLPGIS